MAIYEVEGQFVISSNQVWVPGCYATKRAANYAFRFKNEDLSRLQDAANKRVGGKGGVITFEDLQEFSKAHLNTNPPHGDNNEDQ